VTDKKVVPPPGKWEPLVDSGRGYLSVYLSERLARWPIRAVTKPGDNKSDPNIETATYGLFSTCEPSMRNLIVRNGIGTVFFITNLNGKGRVLSGYYRIGWFAEGARGEENNDFALAASRIRFVQPIDPKSLDESISGQVTTWFRTQKQVDVDTTSRLRETIDSREDMTDSYVAEVSRLERFARSRSGFSYPSWGRVNGFTREDAKEYLKKPGSPVDAPNSSPSGKWRCSSCDYVIKNVALLKRCPVCGELSTLSPDL
jgi:rubrerythrin